MNRQEEKFIINLPELNNILKFFNAYPIYKVRSINSLYFDTEDFQSFTDGEEGLVPRLKYRYRWYGNKNTMPNSGSIEIKETLENYRNKKVFAFQIKNISDISLFLSSKFKRSFYPMSQVSYQRLYFENLTGHRFTFDFDINVKRHGEFNFYKVANTIFEIKYPSNHLDPKYSALLGDKKTRYSKYNESILKLFF